jgi:hypothetical protein
MLPPIPSSTLPGRFVQSPNCHSRFQVKVGGCSRCAAPERHGRHKRADCAPRAVAVDLRDFEDTCYYVPWYRSHRFRNAVAWELQKHAENLVTKEEVPKTPEAKPPDAPARLWRVVTGRTGPNPSARPEVVRLREFGLTSRAPDVCRR